MVANLKGNKSLKKVLLYGLVVLLLLSAAGLLQLVDGNSLESYFYLATVLALGIGSLHVYLVSMVLPEAYWASFWRIFLFTLVLMIASAITIVLIYRYLRLDYMFTFFVLSFILPCLCKEAYKYYMRIPTRTYKLWRYPMNDKMPDLDMIDLTQIEVVQFVFHKKPTDKSQTNFTSKAPLNMNLGQLFFIFINDYNERNPQNTIEYMKDQNNPYAWLFYRKKKWFGRKFFFDTELSFKENSINPNELIYASRVE